MSQDACVYWIARSRDIGHNGEGFEQTKRNIKDVTFVQNKLGEYVVREATCPRFRSRVFWLALTSKKELPGRLRLAANHKPANPWQCQYTFGSES